MAQTPRIGVRESTRTTLSDLAQRRGRAMVDVLDELVLREAGGGPTTAVGTVELHLDPNEASDLCPLEDPEVVEGNGWDAAYVTVLDDTVVEDAVVVLGHQAGGGITEGWSSHRVRCQPTEGEGKTEDAEACATRNGWLYVVGSQYGRGGGPLQAKRSFLARLRLADLRGDLASARPQLTVARNRFALHRAINDALQAAPVELLPVGDHVRECLIDATIDRGERKGKRWAGQVQPGDVPINVEAACFRPDGTLLLGLRHPCTIDGEAILVELRDVDHLVEGEDARSRVGSVWTLPAVGSREEPVGFRGLHTDGLDRYEAVVGNLDSRDKRSALLRDHPQGGVARSQHVRFRLPCDGPGGRAKEVERVHEWSEVRRIEGLAPGPEATVLYVVDEDDRVRLRIRARGPASAG